MWNDLEQKATVNFFGFETIDVQGHVQHHLKVIRGAGDLRLTGLGVLFRQWKVDREVFVPFACIEKVEIAGSHNMKKMWPAKVLRIFYRDGDVVRIVGFGFGGKLSITKGFQSDIGQWKKMIEERMG